MADAYLSDLHSRSSNVGASQTKLRKLGIFPNKPSKLSFARYKPMASDVWSDLLKDLDQGSGLPSPKKEIYLSRNIAHALEKSLRSDLMILNSLDFFREALSVNHTNLVKLVDQSESNLSLDIQQALDVNSLLINQAKFHLIDLLASITHSISTVTLARRDSFLSTVPKHLPDHIVRELRSTNKDTLWMWQDQQEETFNEVKRIVTVQPILKFYSMSQEVTLQCDASEKGLGATILQQ